MTNLIDTVNRALETAKSLGAQNASATVVRAQELELAWRKEKIETLSSAGRSALHINLYVDGKFGSYSTSDLRPDAVKSFIRKNIDMTRLLEEDPARGLPDPERYQNRAETDLELFDENVAAYTAANAVESCKDFEQTVWTHKELPISDVTVQAACAVSESVKATSNGFLGIKKTSSIEEACEMVLSDGEKKPSDYSYASAHWRADLRSHADMANEAAYYAAMHIGQKKIASGTRTLILDRRAAPSFINRYLSPISGGALIRKQSYFENKIGEKLASDLFDLHDDPHIVRGLASALYDAEGMSTHPAPVFEHGTLKQFYLDTYAARKLGLEPTTGSWSNLVLTPGNRSLMDMIKDVKDGIYVTGFLGGNMDAVRGDFSYGIRGIAIENGELTTHVSEMNVTGNFTEIMKRLTEVGNDPRLDSAYRIPSLRFDDVAFSGA